MTAAAIDVAGYTFKAENLCKECTVEVMNKAGLIDEVEGAIEDLIEFAATRAGVDLEDHHSFDSDDFPKSFTLDQLLDEEQCMRCEEFLVPHAGYRMHFTGAWFCLTCDSPYCDRA